MLGVNILLAAIPSVIILRIFYKQDRNRSEPKGLLLHCFFLGFLSLLPALVIEFGLIFFERQLSGILIITFRAFIVAGLVEEGAKLFVVKSFIYHRVEFNEMTDGIVFTIAASLGFAFFENLFYSFGPPSVLIIRGLTAVPLHAISAGILGYYIGYAKFTASFHMRKGLFLAVLVHGFYDFFLFLGPAFSFLVFPLLIFSGFWLKALWQKAIHADKEAERV
ncbi:MAG: PrsW family intramembrane metalloprotease [Spirochaetia bacterium]